MTSVAGLLRRPVVIATMIATKAAIFLAIAGVFGWSCTFATIATALISLLKPDNTTLISGDERCG